MRLRLHPDSGFNEGLFVAYDDDGDVCAQGYLEVERNALSGERPIVRFVDVLTKEQVADADS